MDDLIAQGWRVESESTAYLFLVKEQRVNHILHFLVGLLTLGLWWIAWLIIAATGGEERRSIIKSQARHRLAARVASVKAARNVLCETCLRVAQESGALAIRGSGLANGVRRWRAIS